MKKEKIGWIGLGHMGIPMAKNILKGGYDLSVYNRTSQKTELLSKEGAKATSSIGDLCKQTDIIFIMVSDDFAVKEILTQIKKATISNKLIINMSTISPKTSVYLADECKKFSCSYIEAPVSGSVKPAIEGALIILAAGEKTFLERAYPLFRLLSKEIISFDKIGKASTAKLCINYYMGIIVEGMAETVLFGEQKGIDRKTMMEIINDSACGSGMSKMKTNSIIKDEYPAAFPLKHMAKDFRLILEEGINYPFSREANESFQDSLSKHAEEDLMAVIRHLGEGK